MSDVQVSCAGLAQACAGMRRSCAGSVLRPEQACSGMLRALLRRRSMKPEQPAVGPRREHGPEQSTPHPFSRVLIPFLMVWKAHFSLGTNFHFLLRKRCSGHDPERPTTRIPVSPVTLHSHFGVKICSGGWFGVAAKLCSRNGIGGGEAKFVRVEAALARS